MERPPREIYPLLGELLKYDRKSEKWEENVSVKELLKIISFLLDKGFEHITLETLETGDGIKEISIEDIQKKILARGGIQLEQ